MNTFLFEEENFIDFFKILVNFWKIQTIYEGINRIHNEIKTKFNRH